MICGIERVVTYRLLRNDVLGRRSLRARWLLHSQGVGVPGLLRGLVLGGRLEPVAEHGDSRVVVRMIDNRV